MLVLKREDEMKAEYFLLLLSLFGDSMFKSNFDYEVEPHSEGCTKAESCTEYVIACLLRPKT